VKLHSVSFGCQMNSADSSEMARAFFALGFLPADGPDDADALLVNTCTVREHAEHRAVSAIGRLRAWKDARPGRLLVVAGCAAERLGESLRSKFPHVDLVVGARSIGRFPEILEAALGDRCPPAGPPAEPKTPVVAFVTIMRGCSRSCAYCIVPSVRGPEISLPIEGILEEARRLASGGAREIVLLGQTVNGWKGPQGLDFADLLRAAARVPGILRLRFMSPHPGDAGERMAAAMADTPAVAPHIHLPAQSGSDRVLRAMRRGYTRAEFAATVGRLRRARPDLCLSTDLIVGFPGESEEDFLQTLSLIDETGTVSAYCSKFSPRSGTSAARMEDGVPDGVKEERLARLLELLAARRRRHLEGLVGGRVRVLLETPTSGRTEHFAGARLDSPGRPGDLVDAVVTGFGPRGLKCRPSARLELGDNSL
jgi:tRNA-2-methylthio-N6-dimethylallyladenosine synthase